jgi:hypothetical protein
MSAPLRIAGFAAILVLAFALAALAGDAIDPETEGADETAPSGGHESGSSGGHGAGHEDAPSAARGDAPAVRGLAVADAGLRLVVADPELRRGRRERVEFTIVDASGAPVRDFDVAHEKRMHLIVVRRDLTGFQHLHPTQAADGSWTAPVTLPDAGSYRVFADFTRAGEAHTLASDVRVDGPAELAPLPDPATTAVSDGGYDVRLAAGASRAGEEARLHFTITRDGAPVRTEPYLGAGGHLVVLREGDLAFLHVHPSGDAVEFAATFPSPGRYRLFLQFKHEGRVQTVAFTQAVGR